MEIKLYETTYAALAQKLDIDLKAQTPKGVELKGLDAPLYVAEFDAGMICYENPFESSVYLVTEDSRHSAEAYKSIEKAIESFLQKKGWGGTQKPKIFMGVNIEGHAYVMNQTDCWSLVQYKFSD